MLLAPLLLSLAPAPVDPALRGRLELVQGRAILATDSGPRRLGRLSGAVLLAGPGHLELAAGSTAELAWPGLASLRLEGPGSLAWQSLTPQEPLLLELRSLASAELEVRRGPLRVDLPQDWRLGLHTGAYSLEALPGGATVLQHRAGRPARLTWVGGEGYAPPPATLRAGERARLAGGHAAPPASDPSASAGPWQLQDWPWAAPERGAPTWDAWAWPWEEARTSRPGTVESDLLEPQVAEPELVEPASSDAPLAELPRPSALEPADPPSPGPPRAEPWESWSWPWGPAEPVFESEPVTDSEQALHPEPAPPESFAPEPEQLPVPGSFDPALWRGLGEDELEQRDGYWIERNVHLRVDALPDGARVALSPAAPGPCWFFSEGLDVQLFAGASLLLDEDGGLRYHTGSLRIHSADLRR